MADIQVTALPWAQLWRNATPAVRADFLAEQGELYGKCPCRTPVDIYSAAAPDLCDCQTGEKLTPGDGGNNRVTLGGLTGSLFPGSGLLGSVPA